MTRTGATLVLIMTLLAALTLTAQTATPATPPPSAAPAPSAPAQPSAQASPQDQARQTLETLGPKLNLTADQKTKLEPILTNEIQQVRDLRADVTMSLDQKQAKFQQTLTADHAKIDAILTPEQKQKLAEMHQQQAATQGQPQSQPATPQPPKP